MVLGVFPYQVWSGSFKWSYLAGVLLWLGAGGYAYNTLFHAPENGRAAAKLKKRSRKWGKWDTVGLLIFVAWIVWIAI